MGYAFILLGQEVSGLRVGRALQPNGKVKTSILVLKKLDKSIADNGSSYSDYVP